MKVNIALFIVDESINKALMDYSQKLFPGAYSSYILGKDSIPHITLLQVECPQENYKELEHIIDTIDEFTINLTGLTLIPSGDSIRLEILVLKSNLLQHIHERIKDLDCLKNCEIFKQVGDRYRPHITVGFVPIKYCQINANTLNESIIKLQDIKVKLGIGNIGKNSTITERYF